MFKILVVIIRPESFFVVVNVAWQNKYLVVEMFQV